MRLSVLASDIQETTTFAKWILDIGEGKIGGLNDGETIIDIPTDFLIVDSFDPIGSSIGFVYPSIIENAKNLICFQEREIFALNNEVVQEINESLLKLFPGDPHEYLSSDSVSHADFVHDEVDETLYSPDVLNGLRPSGDEGLKTSATSISRNMNIGKVSKVEYSRRKVLDSSSNSSTSKNNIITPKERKVNEVKPRSIKSKKAVIKSGVKTSSLMDTSRDNNQKSKVHKNQITKLPPPYNNTRQKVVSKDPQVATRNKETKLIPKPNALEDSRRTHVSKVSSQVVKEKRSSPTRYESRSYIPIHHIRWEGLDNEVCGHKCNFCNKDLSCSPDKDDDDDDDDYGYDEYDRYSDDENKFQILLPAVDILACGHAFHTECGSYLIPNEQSTDPQCVLCFSMAAF